MWLRPIRISMPMILAFYSTCEQELGTSHVSMMVPESREKPSASVSLSSERLRITAKLQLVEEKDGAIYPVEYKRSTGPNGGDGVAYWENDAIQLCAQGMLLEEEFGVRVPSGVLYYMGSKTRVDVVLDEALRDKTLAAIRTIRELTQRDTPPEPLPVELRHRCHGCSLVTICQ